MVALAVATAANGHSLRRLNVRFHGQSYATVRPRLLKMGYRPVAFAPGAGTGCELRGICQSYPESYACSGTGLGYCLFALRGRSDHRYLVVLTQGDDFLVDVLRRPNPGDRSGIAMALKGL